MSYQLRSIEPKLAQYAEAFHLVGLKGPVGAGKTSLLVNRLASHDYINFEDPRTLMRYQSDPERFLRQLNQHVILDEVQHVPALINTLTATPPTDRHYVLASSCLFRQIRGINTKTLTAIKMLTLLPLQRMEIPNQLREDSIYRGGFPTLVSQQYVEFDPWFAEYVQQHLIQQLPSIGMVSNTQTFQRLLHLLAGQTAKPLNLSQYAHQLAVDVKTIKRWIEILAASFVIFLVPPYHDNWGKRITKSPKLYFYDTGLVSYLTGIETQKQFEYGPLADAIYENYVVMEILKQTLYEAKPAQLYYYRTNHGVQIDLIIETEHRREMICIHHNETFRMRMVDPLIQFSQKDDACYLLYNGADIPYRDNIHIQHISTYLHSPEKGPDTPMSGFF